MSAVTCDSGRVRKWKEKNAKLVDFQEAIAHVIQAVQFNFLLTVEGPSGMGEQLGQVVQATFQWFWS
jgi:hypothetical protein